MKNGRTTSCSGTVSVALKELFLFCCEKTGRNMRNPLHVLSTGSFRGRLREIIEANWVEIRMGDLQDETDLATQPRPSKRAEGERTRGKRGCCICLVRKQVEEHNVYIRVVRVAAPRPMS